MCFQLQAFLFFGDEFQSVQFTFNALLRKVSMGFRLDLLFLVAKYLITVMKNTNIFK